MPEDFGLIAMVMVILSLTDVFVQTGFSDALIAKEAPTTSQKATLYWLNIFQGFFLFFCLYFGAPYFSLLFKEPLLTEMIQTASIIILLASATMQFEALMKKHLYFKNLSIIYIISAILGTVSAILFALNDFGIWSLIYSMIIIQLSNSLQLSLFAYQHKWLSGFYFNLNEVKDFLSFGYFRIGASFINKINSRADQVIIGVLLGPIALGYYSVAFRTIIQPLNKINPILTQVSFPVFSAIKNDNTELLNGYRKGITILTCINAPILLGIAVIAPYLIPFLLGDGWENAILIVQILSVYALLKSIGNVSVGLVLAKEKYKWPFYWNLIILCITPIVLFLAAESTNSIIGVTVALLLLQIFLFIMNYMIFVRRILGNILLVLLGDLIRPILCALIAVSSAFLSINYLLASQPILNILNAVIISVPAYLIASYYLQRKNLLIVLKILKSPKKQKK